MILKFDFAEVKPIQDLNAAGEGLSAHKSLKPGGIR